MSTRHPATTVLTRRRMLALGGGLAAAGTLAACGGGAEPAPQPTGSTSAPTPVLTQWVHRFAEAQNLSPTAGARALDRYAAEFPDARVELTWKEDDYARELTAALAAGVGPDVFDTDDGPTIDQVRSGQIADLSDLFPRASINTSTSVGSGTNASSSVGSGASSGTSSDIHAQVLARLTDRGKIWGVPELLDARLLIYRTSMLDKAGVKPPTTLEELVAACAALTTDKVKGIHLGDRGGADLIAVPVVRSAGLDVLTADQSASFADPKVAAALALLRVLHVKKQILLDIPAQWYPSDAFTQGLAAMQVTGLYAFPAIHKAIGDDVGVLPWPAMAGGRPTVMVSAHTACVAPDSPRLDLAKRYLKWLWIDGADAQLDLATSDGLHIPAQASVAGRVDQLRTGFTGQASAAVKTAGYVLPMRWSPACATALSDAVASVLLTGADAPRALTAAAAIVDAEQRRLGA